MLTRCSWEHTPEWNLTSKLLISKHQQVLLLEAASVLVTMNKDNPVTTEPTKGTESDQSSASPAASGFSDLRDEDDLSSVETTPPPLSEQMDFRGGSDVRQEKRYSGNSSVFSRSYQSAPSASIAGSSVPTAASYGSFHHLSYHRRPSSSGIGMLDPAAREEEAALAAAVELCNFNGTPRTGPTHMDDIPPVPPLPARYASHNASRSINGAGYPGMHDLGVLPPLSHRLSDEREVKMGDSKPSRQVDDEDEYYDHRSMSRGRSDEDDEGVFGRMEE